MFGKGLNQASTRNSVEHPPRCRRIGLIGPSAEDRSFVGELENERAEEEVRR
jgi:hypothetical protein